MKRAHWSEYSEEATVRCERVLITVLGDIGPWRNRLYLVGGLAPRYICGALADGATAHVGTTDVDVVIVLAVQEEDPEAYRTLENNLRKSEFVPESSFSWKRTVDGVPVRLEFLCETDKVDDGRVFKPTKQGDFTGSGLGAFNVRGANLSAEDCFECEIEADRIGEGGGRSKIKVKVAGLLPFTVLKTFAFQDRHDGKDAYDLVYCLLNFRSGPVEAGEVAAGSPVADHPQVEEAIDLLAERFGRPENDGPRAYGTFMAPFGDSEAVARFARDAVAAVGRFVAAFKHGRPTR